MNLFLLAVFLMLPAPLIYLCNRVKTAQQIGIVFLCYILGILLGHLGGIPESFQPIQQTLMSISVGLAIPLLLFSLDIRKWVRTAKTGIQSMGYAMLSITLVTFLLQLCFGSMDPESPKYAAMATGAYTGGTPNIAASSQAIDISPDTFAVFNTYDMIVCTLYMLLLTSCARPMMEKIFRLQPFTGDRTMGISEEACSESCYKGIFAPRTLGKLSIAFLLSAGICLVSDAVGKRCTGCEDAMTILLITTLSIGCSFYKPVRDIPMTTQLGMYIIYIFCFTVASTAKPEKLMDVNHVLLTYVIFAVFGSFFLHALFCKLGNIDSETMVVTSASAICSPPFVPVIAGRLQNKAILVTGIATGIIGYAIGNYLGISVYLLHSKIHF